jgi:hypothetical protein
MNATQDAVTKPEGYCFLMKQNCKYEIFMACCALYFGVVYSYFGQGKTRNTLREVPHSSGGFIKILKLLLCENTRVILNI